MRHFPPKFASNLCTADVRLIRAVELLRGIRCNIANKRTEPIRDRIVFSAVSNFQVCVNIRQSWIERIHKLAVVTGFLPMEVSNKATLF